MYDIFQAWLIFSRGKPINIDGYYGNQCVDVDMALAEAYFPGHKWPELIGYGNAKDLYDAANPLYFEKIPYTPGFVPQPGDMFVRDGTAANPEGHTGAVIDANSQFMHVLQQDGYNPSGVAYEGDLSYSKIIGFLRARTEQLDMPGSPYDTVPTNPDEIGLHYRIRMFREATGAEKANIDKHSWGQILDDNVAELGKRLKAAENNTGKYTKDGVVSWLQNNLN
jgi:hypothetical protein